MAISAPMATINMRSRTTDYTAMARVAQKWLQLKKYWYYRFQSYCIRLQIKFRIRWSTLISDKPFFHVLSAHCMSWAVFRRTDCILYLYFIVNYVTMPPMSPWKWSIIYILTGESFRLHHINNTWKSQLSPLCGNLTACHTWNVYFTSFFKSFHVYCCMILKMNRMFPVFKQCQHIFRQVC